MKEMKLKLNKYVFLSTLKVLLFTFFIMLIFNAFLYVCDDDIPTPYLGTRGGETVPLIKPFLPYAYDSFCVNPKISHQSGFIVIYSIITIFISLIISFCVALPFSIFFKKTIGGKT